MSCKVIIDYGCTITRIAVVECGKMIGLYLDDQITPSLQDTIIQGRVEKVVKNLQGVFVQFGQEKNGLLHCSQIPECYEGKIQQGKKLAVQIKRENVGDKGHKLSANLNIKGDKLICMPFDNAIAFSKKIKDKQIKDKIKELFKKHNNSNYGFMVRTKANECELEVLEQEIKMLIERTRKVLQLQEAVIPGTVLWTDEPLYIQVIKELLGDHQEVECITNNEQVQGNIKTYLEGIGIAHRVQYNLVCQNENLFQLYSLEKSFENILKQKIWLKNGGNIVVEYTEAMTVIDVNSAKAVEGKNKRRGIVELNELAIEEAIGQVIKRNLSGIIMIDLVDVMHKEDKEILYKFAKDTLTAYKDSRTKIYPLTDLDLLQMARTKEQLPYRSLLLENCKACGQEFKKLTPLFVSFKLENKLKKIVLNTDMKQIIVHSKKELSNYLQENDLINKFNAYYGIKIVFQENNKIEELYDIKYCE